MPAKTQGHDTRYLKLQKNNCFVCGQNNPDGMRLKFVLDESRQTFVCRFRLGKRYTGPPGHCHGGVIACILDDGYGQSKQTPSGRSTYPRDDGGIFKAGSSGQASPRRRPRGRSARPQAHQHCRNSETKKTKCWRAAAVRSLPSIPKKCSQNLWNDNHPAPSERINLTRYESNRQALRALKEIESNPARSEVSSAVPRIHSAL